MLALFLTSDSPEANSPMRNLLLTLILAVSSTQLCFSQELSRQGRGNPDTTLRRLLQQHGVSEITSVPAQNSDRVELGRMLFYDRILSGNRDISCATCHHDFFGLGDGLSLSLGVGGTGLGPDRERGPGREFVPRNAPEVFNRGLPEWRTQFWDSRVEKIGGTFISPAGSALPDPDGFEHVLEIQAMFPVTSRDEMRGADGDLDVFGDVNELALIDDTDLPGMWNALMDRLLGPEGATNPDTLSYADLFAAAYPEVEERDLGFEHAARAIAAYEADAFTLLDAPWDDYLAGDNRALSTSAKRGAQLFYGRAGCVRCHSGNLMTDQEHHNILTPQIGPGKAPEAPLDFGRSRETGEPGDAFAFRTPPLRNVAATGPWTHDGAFTSLEGVIKHHLRPIGSFLEYDASQLSQEELAGTVQNSLWDLISMIWTADRRLLFSGRYSRRDVQDLVAFLESLTSPSLETLAEVNLPEDVPSGLPVDGVE